MIRAVAFDFDGVLVESVEVKTRAFARLFAGEGPEAVSRIVDYHRRHGGVPRFDKFRAIYRDILRRPLPDAQFERLCRDFAGYVVDEVVAAPWVAGAEAFVSGHRKHYRLFVVSGTPEEELREIIRRRRASDWFDDVRGSPAAKAVLLKALLADHSLQPEELAVIGDASTDWTAARQVGSPFIWRRAYDDASALEGFRGPSIADLTDLARHLAACGAAASPAVR